MQNRSTAVMQRRFELAESPDDFPTPLWATRAFCHHVLKASPNNKLESVLEPACGRGYMAAALREYFSVVVVADRFDYGQGAQQDFIESDYGLGQFEWVITNPPFKLAEEFILKGLEVAHTGVAMLVRTSFIESVGRYDRLFKTRPPAIVAQYVERVPMVRARLERGATTATSYCWLVWQHEAVRSLETKIIWIPPSKAVFDRDSDWPPAA